MTEYALEITGLKKVYNNNVEALKGIDLKITKGDFFALLGPNGAGKSSTIGIISSITNKTDGNIKIFGVDIDQNFPKAKSFLGVVAQEINFSQFEKVEDIVITQAGFYGIPKDIAKERCKNLLKKLPLQYGEKLEEIPNVLAVREKSLNTVMEMYKFKFFL